MPNFEDIYKKIFADPQAWVKLLIGGLLSFIPVVNLLAMGYVRRYARQIRESGDFALPSWRTNPVALLLDGVYLFVVAVLFGVLPIVLAMLLAALIDWMTGGFVRALAFVVVSPVCVLAPALVAAANYRFVAQADWKSALDFKIIFGMAAATWRTLLVPTFAVWGFVALFMPIYGISAFIGWLGFFAYATLVFVYLEKQGVQAVA